jgi:LysM repeat protein
MEIETPRRRKPSLFARILAPIALLAAIGAVYLVVNGAVDNATNSATTTVATVEKKKKPVKKTYVVKKGDTVSGISAKYGVSITRIQELNGDLDVNTLRAGQKIRLAK